MQNGRLPLPTISSTRTLERLSEKRSDRTWIRKQLYAKNTRVLLLVDLDLCVRTDTDRGETAIRWYSAKELRRIGIDLRKTIFLGHGTDGHNYFTARFAAAEASTLIGGVEGLRPLADLGVLARERALAPDDLALVGEARALAAWHQMHRCCGRCGAYTASRDAGWKRQCWACGQTYFPRSDPAVIMLISNGERALLGRHKRFPNMLYSVLAGFMEPGEDIEDAVRRETFEEAGIEVGRVEYMGSQPWPFPHSLMIGCWGEALTSRIRRDEAELQDVRWFARGEVQAMLAGTHQEGIRVPGKLSIARALIDRFAQA